MELKMRKGVNVRTISLSGKRLLISNQLEANVCLSKEWIGHHKIEIYFENGRPWIRDLDFYGFDVSGFYVREFQLQHGVIFKFFDLEFEFIEGSSEVENQYFSSSYEGREIEKKIQILKEKNHPAYLYAESGIHLRRYSDALIKKNHFDFDALTLSSDQIRNGLNFENFQSNTSVLIENFEKLNRENQIFLIRMMEEFPNIIWIAHSNKSLEELVQNYEFLDQLFYKFFPGEIQVIPLRLRRADLQDFVLKTAKKLECTLSPNAIKILLNQDFFGNEDEVVCVIQNSLLNSKTKVIRAEDLVLKTKNNIEMGEIRKVIPLRELEKRMIEKALKETNGNRAQSAKLLGMGRSTLFEKLKTYKIAA